MLQIEIKSDLIDNCFMHNYAQNGPNLENVQFAAKFDPRLLTGLQTNPVAQIFITLRHQLDFPCFQLLPVLCTSHSNSYYFFIINPTVTKADNHQFDQIFDFLKTWLQFY